MARERPAPQFINDVGCSICDIMEKSQNVAIIRIAVKTGHKQTVVARAVTRRYA
jgi:hypothetical protein